ncbi:Flotillin-1 [Toxocara canis]|uniref:Flotillin-1 n=1 Tax=Toxocara canis TaxID=6265 RepID=A0A0B2UT59_TOXCA|nr:Flotillin-1 [Toxocara canis]
MFLFNFQEALAEEERQIEKYKNDIEIAKAKRDYELKQAGFDLDVNINKAKADFAYQLQAAKTKQALKEEDMQVQIVERTAAINVAEEEITRKERELDAIVRRPAEAEKYRLEKLAKAEKQRIILEAEANAEAEKVSFNGHIFFELISVSYSTVTETRVRNKVSNHLRCFALQFGK